MRHAGDPDFGSSTNGIAAISVVENFDGVKLVSSNGQE